MTNIHPLIKQASRWRSCLQIFCPGYFIILRSSQKKLFDLGARSYTFKNYQNYLGQYLDFKLWTFKIAEKYFIFFCWSYLSYIFSFPKYQMTLTSFKFFILVICIYVTYTSSLTNYKETSSFGFAPQFFELSFFFLQQVRRNKFKWS